MGVPKGGARERKRYRVLGGMAVSGEGGGERDGNEGASGKGKKGRKQPQGTLSSPASRMEGLLGREKGG